MILMMDVLQLRAMKKGSKILRFENDYESIWTKLRLIVEELIWTKDTYKKSSMELHDVLFVMSTDPDKITFFDLNYGSKKVEIAIKEASALIYPDGNVDLALLDFFWQKRFEVVNTFSVSYPTKSTTLCNWAAITDVVIALHNDYIFNVPKHLKNQTYELQAKKYELYVTMAVDPISFLNKVTSLELGQSKVVIGISVCTHILERVSKQCPTSPEYELFKSKRNNLIKKYALSFLKKKHSAL